MLFDTHCHLNFKDFDNDRDEIIGRCLDPSNPLGQVWIINVGADWETSQKAVEIAEKYDKGVYAAAALHPHNAGTEKFNYKKYKNLAENSKVVAIGECGLDYQFCENDGKIQKLQQKIFKEHLKLAQELNKPIIIHSRRLFPEILEIIKTNYSNTKAGGVLHCYMGRWSYAKEYLKLGFYISFTGLITYARDYDKVIKNTPLERILIETDAPYLTPVPLRQARGKPFVKNSPLNVELVARKIAEIKGIGFEEVANQTTQNAKKLFNLL
jgi:TatD DNase family protein